MFSLVQLIQTQQIPEGHFNTIWPEISSCCKHFTEYIHSICEIRLLRMDCLSLPKQQNGNNDINDPTNEYGACTCILVLLLNMKLRDFKANPIPAVAARNGRTSPRSTLWNSRLSCLLILEERYSQACASSRAGEPFRGRLLCTDSHYWYTSHIHPPTRSTAATSRRKAPTRTHFHRQRRTCRHTLHVLEKLLGVQCVPPNPCSTFQMAVTAAGFSGMKHLKCSH